MRLGLYLGFVFGGRLGLAAFATLLGHDAVASDAGWPWRGLYGAIKVTGAGGASCGLGGTLYLLGLRLCDRGLRDMSDSVTFFNLNLLAAVFGSGLWAWGSDPNFVAARLHLESLLRGQPSTIASASLAWALVFAGPFMAYRPFSRMSHAVAKYFFYYAILWDEEPMRAGASMEHDISQSLSDRVTWSAAHIRRDRSWREQLATDQNRKGPPGDP